MLHLSAFIVAIILSLPLASTPSQAQTHLGFEDIPLSLKAKGDFYLSQGKYKKSLDIYKKILQDGVDSNSIFRNMVRAWNAMKALDEAEKYLTAYRWAHEKSSAVNYALGYLYYLKNEDIKAEKQFNSAIELDSKNSWAWNNWAALLAKGKHFQQAVEKVKIAIRTNPEKMMFFLNLKKIYAQMGEVQRFEEEYHQALKEGQKDMSWGYGKTLARSMRQKSFLAYSKNDIAGAIAGFEKILGIYQNIGDTKGQVPALFSLGLLFEENGDAHKGQEFYRQVLAINPEHIQAKEKVKPLKEKE
ncbi:MAG: hypothetical protein HOL15_00575 [Nitrospinaceae bacterium]|nr:hypothetical protein [Nitrospina sp.]MBT5375289.1 hypothetical protein [Nitrospinaceae bacterium]MBT5867900.1 hypothetical protein [Nitrospinaceae bacterium]MBT6345477.1 hypothetical protein [Nitrospina sp.]